MIDTKECDCGDKGQRVNLYEDEDGELLILCSNCLGTVNLSKRQFPKIRVIE